MFQRNGLLLMLFFSIFFLLCPLDEILGSLAKKCSPGGRVIISHPQGRLVLEQQRKQYSKVVVLDLPDRTSLQIVADAHSFDLAKFVDEPDFYLAVLIS
ncbi:hypothetical protein S83_032554 [Arachis hypogaea]